VGLPGDADRAIQQTHKAGRVRARFLFQAFTGLLGQRAILESRMIWRLSFGVDGSFANSPGRYQTSNPDGLRL
jgi:hypothetical protein